MNLKEMLVPVWDTEVVYGESLMMVAGEPAPLLYTPLEILSVTNAAETEVYEEGKDYRIEAGCLVRTPESRIFAFERAELYPAQGEEGKSFPYPEGYVYFSEGHYFHDRQIAVTYTCKKGEWSGVRPESAKEKLPRTMALLEAGKPLTLLAYGDSITAGGNASKLTQAPPYQPNYSELVALGLEEKYGSKVEYINTAVGGKRSKWGLEEAAERAAAHCPDLMLLAFGMNDGKAPLEELQSNLRGIIEETRKGNPATEVILVATSTPNPLLTDPRARFWGNQIEQKPYLDALAAELEGVAVADVTGMQQYLHSKKRFMDTTGNHVNHPNDFFHRLYAQVIMEMLK